MMKLIYGASLIAVVMVTHLIAGGRQPGIRTP